MTNKQLVNKYNALHRKASKLTDKMIEQGFGHVTPIEMRGMANKPAIVQTYLDTVDAAITLRYEAERRYGPGLHTVDMLCWK